MQTSQPLQKLKIMEMQVGKNSVLYKHIQKKWDKKFCQDQTWATEEESLFRKNPTQQTTATHPKKGLFIKLKAVCLIF